MLKGIASAGALYGLGFSSASAEELENAEQVIVRAEEVEPDALPFGAGVVDELKETAAESQEPIVEAIEETDGVKVANQFWLANALLAEVDPDEIDIDELREVEGVWDIHPNFKVEIPELQESDTDGGDDEITYGLDQINAPDVWEEFDTKGEGARISVLDTGIDPDHPDLDIDPENFEEFDDEGKSVGSAPYDSGYHGTHVSGTVVGPEEPVGDEEKPGYGVAPEATLMHGLVLPDGGGTFAQIIGGMEWSVENDADAINMSLGAIGYFAEMIEPVRNAERAGTMVISSSGNDGDGTSGSPANVYDSVAIGASDEDEEIAEFSSGEVIDTDDAWGAAALDDWPDEYVVPDVSAPGVEVLSAIPEDESVPFTDCGDGDIYCEVSGTSMASPHVAGLVALMESAAVEEFDVDQMKAGFKTTSWKPEDAPEEQDTRYGRGIVDALHATARVAADSGVEGTVYDAEAAEDTPIERADVDLEGFPTETGADGEYRLRALEGEYDITADAFGFETLTVEDVSVSENEFSTLDFDLDRELAVALVEDQPEVIEAGEEFDLTVQVANLQQLTVDLASTYQGEAWLEVDGEVKEFGEPIEFDELLTDQVTVTVTTSEDGVGALELDHTFEWVDRDQTIELTTGPTEVVEEIAPVAVVDVEDGAFGDALVAALDDRMSPRYAPELIAAEDALAAAEGNEYEAFVVQNLGIDLDDPDEDNLEYVEDFVEETAHGDTGVLWLDQFGDESHGIPQLAAATDDPGATFEAFNTFFFPPTDPSIYYHVEEEHATVDDVAEEGDAVAVNTPFVDEFAGVAEFHTYFENYDGRVAGEVISGVDPSSFGFDPEDALAVDEIRSAALASSLGFAPLVQRQDFEDAGEEILANAATFAAETPPIRDVSLPDDRADPGENIEWVFEVDDLVEVEIGLTDTLATDEDEFTLIIDGEEAEFDDPVEFDEPLDDELTITLETAEDTVGRFRLDTRFVTLDRVGQEQTTSVTFRPVSVYEPPLRVPQDVEDPQDAIDLVAPGEEIIIDDGTYEVDEPDRGFQSGLYIGKSEITLRAAEDATPEIIHERDLPAPNVVNVDADGVTLEGIHANVVDGEIDEKNTIGMGIRVNELTSGVTVRDGMAAGTGGVFFDSNTSDIYVEGTTIVDSAIGVGTDIGFGGGPVDDVTVENVSVERPDDFGWGGVYTLNADDVTVRDCEIEFEENYDAGIRVEGDFGATGEAMIEDNEITGVGTEEPLLDDRENGIWVDDIDAEIRDNHIEDVFTGIRTGDFGFEDGEIVIEYNTIENAANGFWQNGDYVTLEQNRFDAEIGLHLGEDPDETFPTQIEADQVLAQYNDLSETDLPFFGEPDEPFFDPPEFLIFDCRQNFLGDREYDETIADGDIEYEPFLTDPPDEIDFSQPIEIGIDLYLDPGETYGLGIPGPCDQTLWDVLGVEEGGGHNKFEGDVSRWARSREQWRRVTGHGSLSDQDSLVGFKVEPEEGVRAVMHFQFMEDAVNAPPGRRDRDLGEIEVDEGTNIVCAPAYGDEAMFDEGTAEIELVEPKELKPPGKQMSEWKADDKPKKPFSAYYVEVSEAGTIECDLDEYDPTKDDLYKAFGLDPQIHEDPGAGSAGTDSLDVTVEDVIVAAENDEEAKEAVFKLTGHRLADTVEPDDDTDVLVNAIEESAETTMEGAPADEEELVEEAVQQAVAVAIQSLFGARIVEDPEEDSAEQDFIGQSTAEHAQADD